jgi:hypothetical protein
VFLNFLILYLYLDEDTLKQPVLQPNRRNILIEQVEIDMEPSINMFEEELCRLINKDRIEKKRMGQTTVTALVQETHNKVSIVERRLRVSCFIFFHRKIFFYLGRCT